MNHNHPNDKRAISMPGILKEIFDMLGVDVVKNRALPNMLLSMKQVEC